MGYPFACTTFIHSIAMTSCTQVSLDNPRQVFSQAYRELAKRIATSHASHRMEHIRAAQLLTVSIQPTDASVITFTRKAILDGLRILADREYSPPDYFYRKVLESRSKQRSLSRAIHYDLNFVSSLVCYHSGSLSGRCRMSLPIAQTHKCFLT